MEVSLLSSSPFSLEPHRFDNAGLGFVESLCMKGLFFCCLDKKPEGYEIIKRGVEKDSQSHIVWHVYAIALRADKRWEEALDCYKKACAIEKVRYLVTSCPSLSSNFDLFTRIHSIS